MAALLLVNLPVPPQIAAAAGAANCTVVATADGRPLINPSGTGPGTGKRIGFDNTHGSTAGQADWVIDGGFSDMACALAGIGYTVEELRTYPLTTAVMNGYDVVVFPESNIPFTTNEMAAIEAYVAGGKGVLFVGDHYQADRNLNTWDSAEVFNGFRRGHYGETFTSPAYNYNGVKVDTTYTFNNGTDWMATAFGLRFRYNAFDLSGANFHAGNSADPEDPGILPADKTFGMTAGVSSVATYAGATLSIVDPTRAMGIVYPNKNALKRWSNAQSDDPAALYTDTVGAPAGGTSTFGGINEGAYVAIAKPNAGKVAAAGDSSLWEDRSPKYTREIDGTSKSTHDGWLDSDHDTLGINVVNWLATPDPTPGIAPALQQPVTPEPLNPFTIGEPIVEPWNTPPASYKWYDACTFRAGAYIGTTTCDNPPPPQTGWSMSSVSANVYPNNLMAAYLNATGFTPNTPLTHAIYWYVNGAGTQISRHYNRSTGTFEPGTTNQTLTTDAEGNLKRWEFWEMDNAAAIRNLNLRIKVGTNNAYTSPLIPQAAESGTYGFLTVEQSLGYSNGLHALLFTRSGTLDTAVGLRSGADTTITLPPGVYTLDIHDDSGLKRGGIPVTITAGQTVSLAQILTPVTPGWTWQNVPANAYPGNTLAVFLNGQGLTPGTTYSTKGYVYLTGGAQVSKRYNRTTGQFVDGQTAQDLTADAQGNIKRYEFWQLTKTSNRTADYNVRIQVNGTNRETKLVKQVDTGSFGYLTVEQSLGYSNGLHAALFTKAGSLDTAVGINAGADTTVTLPAGAYTLDIRDDAGVVRGGIAVTITAGQTESLAQILNPGPPPSPTWAWEYVGANVYPGNKLAAFANVQNLPPDSSVTYEAYVYLTGGAQVGSRYDRATGGWVSGTAPMAVTTDSTGSIQRWEIWQIATNSNKTADYNIRLRQGSGNNRATNTLKQVATGDFGYLTVEQTLGYSDGLHVALFSKGGVLDTVVGLNQGANTAITLPAGTYTLDIRNDAGVRRGGINVTITAGQTTSLDLILNPPQPVWAWEFVGANVYPGNKLAAFANIQNLPANSAQTFDAYVYLTGGAQVSSRYDRATGEWASVGIVPMTVTTDATGSIQRWEIWQIAANANKTADYNIRLRQNGNTKVTKQLKQVATGAFGYLTIGQSFGYDDGLHVALFTRGGVLDTVVGLNQGADTTITLPAGTYTMEIRTDAGAALSDVTFTITEGVTSTLTAILDKTAPTITGVAAPAPNAEGWNNTDVTVTFTCADLESGVASCTDPVTLTAEGADLGATGTAVDNAGNTATATVGGINIDKTAPVIDVEGDRTYSADETVTLTCTATDHLSGLAGSNPCAEPLVSAPAYTFAPGAHEVTVTAVDKAGNSTTFKATFTVEVTYNSVAALIERFVEQKGTANSLTAKLRNGALEALRHELAAQSGKHVPAEAATILDELVQMLMQ
ncbi:MAG: endonuclease [Symbiobacteriaceae bacterium]|jgi:hypothetical protein|nr:endonuclease [Symbiobacteriaceae bacterium]